MTNYKGYTVKKLDARTWGIWYGETFCTFRATKRDALAAIDSWGK